MRGWGVVVTAMLGVGACHRPAAVASDGGTDAPLDAPDTDAPPDAPSAYSLSIGTMDVVASGLIPRTVSVTGLASDDVTVGLDHASAGTLAPKRITLDASGHGTVVFTPCTDVSPNCLGPATLTLALSTNPGTLLAHGQFVLVAPAEVGEVAPCLTGGDVLYLHGNNQIYTGQLQTGSAEPWTVLATPDQIELDVGDVTDRYRGIFSLVGITTPLAPGTYEQATQAVESGHPGIEVSSPGIGCNPANGRFKVYDYTADPILGTVSSVTISFEQVCDGAPGVVVGCFHYETAVPNPITCPAPDPTKVSVQVLSTSHDGTPDTGATAIFTDSTGTVVLDTQVDACGQAQASLPAGGSLTTIESAGGTEILHTYRGLTTGDHVLLNPRSTRGGASDLMLATFAPPVGANNLSLMTACGGGSWSSGTGPVSADLTFYDGCRTPTFDMLSIASFPTAVPHQFVWQTGLTHAANGNIFAAMNWAPMGTAIVTLANVPASSPSMNVTWSTMIDATSVLMGGQRVDSPVAGDQTVSLSYPPGAGDGAVVNVDIFLSLLSSESRAVVASGVPSSVMIDFASQPIPIVSAVQQTAIGASWTETPGGTADVRTTFWRATLQSGVHVTWTVIEPYDGQPSMLVPSLPAAHAAEDPTADPGAQLFGASVSYIDYDTLSGFSLSPPTGNYHSHSSTSETFNMQFGF